MFPCLYYSIILYQVTLPILNKLHKYSTVFEVLQSGLIMRKGDSEGGYGN